MLRPELTGPRLVQVIDHRSGLGKNPAPEAEGFRRLLDQHPDTVYANRRALHFAPPDERCRLTGVGQIIAKTSGFQYPVRQDRQVVAQAGRRGIENKVETPPAELL